MTITYEEAKAIAYGGDAKARKALAADQSVAPELLYFLAEDKSVDVRCVIAANPTAPLQANLLLAGDSDEQVRAIIAEKLVVPIVEGGKYESAKLRELADQALMLLAKDQEVRVRQILAEALQEVAHAPADVIRRLAWDVEAIVAEPVIMFSPVLNDSDLIEIILAKPSLGAVSAVSKRDGVSEDVSDAIVESDDIEAIALLLGNESAQIREEALDRVIATAEKIDLLQMPLAMRPQLPSRTAVKVARVVAEDVLKRMQERQDFSDEVTTAVRSVVLERIGDGIALRPDTDPALTATEGGMHPDQNIIFDKAAAQWAAGSLDETTLLHELTDGDLEFAKAILAVMADVPFKVVQRVAETRSVKGCVALSWRAGLRADSSEIVQLRLGQVDPKEIMRARGSSYPIPDGDMIWQIDYIRNL